MSTPLNAACFDQPHWRVIAAGFEPEVWFDQGCARGTGGIANPQPTHLRTGQHYYRFARSATTLHSRLGSGWWLEYEAFHAIDMFAKGNGYRLVDAARLCLALPYGWTGIDLLVKALLKAPVKAYTGHGKPVETSSAGADKGTRWIPPQHLHLRQLYIPGLYNPTLPGGEKQPYEQAFQLPPTVTRL